MCGAWNILQSLGFHILLRVTNRKYSKVSPPSIIHQSSYIIHSQGGVVLCLPIRCSVALTGTRSSWITTKVLSSCSRVQCAGWLCGWTSSALPWSPPPGWWSFSCMGRFPLPIQVLPSPMPSRSVSGMEHYLGSLESCVGLGEAC